MTTKTKKAIAVESAMDANVAPAPMTMEAPKEASVKVAAAKGRPMLSWVGKRPLDLITAFPAQPIERVDPQHVLGSQTSDAYAHGGLLFHGDNKEVLAHLLASGFRGKVNLVYIDPPFDSGADYVRKVNLRGGGAKLEGETYTLGEQKQYTDIWANDNYLQFMYERLMVLKELMAKDSTIWLHCNPAKSHLLRCVMDEIFGQDNFRNEVVWWYWNKMQGNVNRFASNHDVILCYQQGSPPFKKIEEEREAMVRQLKRAWDPKTGSLVNARDENGALIYQERTERTLDDVWRLSMLQPADDTENLRYPTQKPESLLQVITESSTKRDDLVLDCFIGSGTTAAVAQKLGRRWIGCDINKGAIQTTSKRLQSILAEQAAEDKAAVKNGRAKVVQTKLDVDDMAGDDETVAEVPATTQPAQLAFSIWRVNDYDLHIQHNEAVELACQHLGVTRTKGDSFFEGTRGQSLVKIVPFNHPLSPLDLEEVKTALSSRPDETRPVLMVCLGVELAAQAWLEDYNRMRKISDPNRIDYIELRTDAKYGKFFAHQSATAQIVVTRHGKTGRVKIENFASPTILERLAQTAGVLSPKIDDWRAMVDCVLIDTAYDGQVFNVVLSDVPERKSDLVSGDYDVPLPQIHTTVGVKIIDMLGEEVLETVQV